MKFERRSYKTKRKKWTDDELNLLNKFVSSNQFSLTVLHNLIPNHSIDAIRSKFQKLRIATNDFGNSYKAAKQKFTYDIASETNPKIVFDAYAGTGLQSFEWLKIAHILFISEKNSDKIEALITKLKSKGFYEKEKWFNVWRVFQFELKTVYIYQGYALEAAKYIGISNYKIDVLDLDTCGTTLPSLPIFLFLINPKYLVITHGEFQSYRFKREDVLRRIMPHRDIQSSFIDNVKYKNLPKELEKATKTYALRTQNETNKSYWLKLLRERFFGDKINKFILRRLYLVKRPDSTADCLNDLVDN